MNILDFSTYIFDLDGVIINSEPIHYNCYKEALLRIVDYNLDWNEYCKIHHSLDNSFEKIFPENYENIYNLKKELYKNEINNINLIDGFYDFFNLLIKNGKIICIVTDATDEIIELISKRFPFLKKCNIIITRNSSKKRKPDSHCYLSLLDKLPKDIENHHIIAFEDSYKGWISATNAIYNCILINNENYVYYNMINAANKMNDFKNISELLFKLSFNYLPFYISSKTHHRDKWLKLQTMYPIVANWIHINKNKEEINTEDKEYICNVIQDDINSSVFGILYLEKNEKEHIGSLIEIGLLLANQKKIYICGDNIFKDEVLFNFKKYLNFSHINNFDLNKVFMNIQYDMNEDYQKFIKKINHHQIDIISNQIQNKNENIDIIDYIVISASGKGSRLLPITQHIPKLLVNVDNLNILNKIINYWKKYSKKFVIVIDSKYNEIVDFYLKLTDIQYEIINVDCNDGQENSYTIHKALQNNKFINKKILITWCDIYPETIIPIDIFDTTNIIFTYKNFGRYDAIDNMIIKKPYGNIIGIYYFGSFKQINIFEPKMDICDCYKENFGDFNSYEIEVLTDIGDYQKLCYYINNKTTKYSTRYFNQLTDLPNNIIEKQSTCEYGDKVIINEMAFFKYHTLNNIPEIIEFKNNSYKMKKILNANNLINVFNNSNIKLQQNIILSLLTEIEKIHIVEHYTVDKRQLFNDIRIEFYDKVIYRLDNIRTLLSYFNFVKSVNNVPIRYDHTYIIEEIYSNIMNYFLDKNTYNTIHGDPHMSNILIDDINNIWFIDPRGYFGNTKLFGLKEYDISKIIYSLSGFDHINNNDNHFFIINDTNNIIVNITNNINNFLHLFNNYNKNILIYMTILHWFGLTDYSKNNIHKCISSYYYGIYLYHLYFVNT